MKAVKSKSMLFISQITECPDSFTTSNSKMCSFTGSGFASKISSAAILGIKKEHSLADNFHQPFYTKHPLLEKVAIRPLYRAQIKFYPCHINPQFLMSTN